MSKERSLRRLMLKERRLSKQRHEDLKIRPAVPLGFRMDKKGKYLEEDPEDMKRLKKVYNAHKKGPEEDN